MINGFKNFILRGNVIDLAVAVVIGGAFGKIVDALVKDLITPLIGLIGGQPDFSYLVVTVNNNKFMVGDFVNALISFIIISTVVYFFIVLPVNSFLSRVQPKQS